MCNLKGLCLFAAVSLSLLSATAAASSFEASPCRLDSRLIILCFDLRDDIHPKAGLIVYITVQDKKDVRVFLPFHTTAFEPDTALLAAWGNYETFTSVSFVRASPGMHDIGFIPVFDSNQDPLEETSSGATLILQRRGLERRFVYNHHLASNARVFPPEVQQIESQSLDAIAVVRPKNATGLWLPNGNTEEPAALPESASTRYYPAVDSKGAPSRIVLRYELPATPLQTMLLSNIPKVAGALAAPLVTIAFFGFKENIRPRTRRIVLWVLGVIQFVILCWLVYAVWNTRNEQATSAAVDWLIVAVTAVASAVPLWLKREPKQLTLGA